MRIRPVLFGLFALIVFLAPVVIAQATGTWATSGRAAAGADAGPGAGDGAGGGNGGGTGDGGGRVVVPGDARGWMTLAEVAEANAVDVAEIVAAFGLPPTIDPGTRLSELESDSFSVEALRTWLAARSSP